MEIKVFILRLLVALIAGGFIGLERQFQNKSAGLRTNILVCIGAAMYVLIAIQMTAEGGDVTRIVGQVVTGIGFLGAGVILHQGMDVLGLTTAATIWCSSAVGCLAGAGFYIESAICAGLVVFVNAIFWRVDNWLAKRRNKE